MCVLIYPLSVLETMEVTISPHLLQHLFQFAVMKHNIPFNLHVST